MNLKYTSLFVLSMSMALGAKSQSEFAPAIPNQFHGFTLGTALCDLSTRNLKESKDHNLNLLSIIKTKNMSMYSLKNQLTEGGDKIDIDFFFYNDSLSVIRVAYKDQQSHQGILDAVKMKYGNEARLDDNLYHDSSSGSSRIIENLYWEKSACCVLNLTSTDIIGLVYLTFAQKDVQVKLKSLELINNQKRIN